MGNIDTAAKHRVNETELVELLRSECHKTSVRQWALQHNINAPLIWDILRYRVRPTPKIYFALGYRRVVEYERIAK